MNKEDLASVAGNVNTSETSARNALHVLKSKPRKGKDLEQLKTLESIVQAFEYYRLIGTTK